jgi:hypothetical protein
MGGVLRYRVYQRLVAAEPRRGGGFPLIQWEEGDRGRWWPGLSVPRRVAKKRRGTNKAVQSYLTLALSFQ